MFCCSTPCTLAARLNPQPAKLGELALALSLFKAQLSNPGVTEVCSLTYSRRGRGRMSKRNENRMQGRAMQKGQSVKQTVSFRYKLNPVEIMMFPFFFLEVE